MDVVHFLDACRASNPELAAAATRSIEVILGALHVYRPEEVVFSFNGGKDSTAVLHLLRGACALHEGRDAAKGEALFRRIRAVHFATKNNFPEVEAFMRSTMARYAARLDVPPRGARRAPSEPWYPSTLPLSLRLSSRAPASGWTSASSVPSRRASST